SDPGRYHWAERARNSVSLCASPILRDYRDGSDVSFEVERTISSTACPLTARGVRYVGIRLQHVLRIRRAKSRQRVDLWHIVQIPAGSRTIVPTLDKPKPVVYFNARKLGNWKL